jgi:hypothetical protein
MKLRRNVMVLAVTAVLAGLIAYVLPASRAALPSASSGTASGNLDPPSASRTCASPTVVPMNPGNAQSGIAEGSYFVTNDTWNAGRYRGLSQAIYVCNYNNWYAVATMNNDTGDGAVKTSPNVQETWYPTPTPLNRWYSITSDFSDVPPGTGAHYGIWEFEYDIWLNGLADSSSTEVMIWTYNNGQTPAGARVGWFSDAGQSYRVYHRSAPYQYIAFVDRSNRLSGQVNLVNFFNYAVSRGWMPSSSTLYQICNGMELVSTNSRPEKFTINNFAIDMKAYS